MDVAWPEILTYITSNPDCTPDSLWNIFGGKCGDISKESFKNGLLVRGYGALKAEMKSAKKAHTVKESKDMTQAHIQNFQKVRQRRGIVHLKEMDSLIENVTGLVKKEAKGLSENDKLTSGKIAGHIGNLSSLHKLADSVYNINGATNESNVKINIAILTGMNLDDQEGDFVDEDDVMEAEVVED